MAVDTRDKRGSCFAFALPFGRIYPLADGAISQGDRQQTALSYRGILAAAAAAGAVMSQMLTGVGR